MLFGVDSSLTSSQVTRILERHADDVDAASGCDDCPVGRDKLSGWGGLDVSKAVDFLQSGPLPFPELGRPRVIAGWGVSLGAVTLLLAAAKEPAIRALVSDSGYPDFASILEREVPKRGHLPPLFTPGALRAAQALYGINYYAVRPVDIVASIAPRPIFFIHGDKDSFNPSTNMFVLATAARSAPDAHVQTWLVPGADHAQSFNTAGQQYVTRVTDFYNVALGPDTGRVSGS